MNILAIRKYLLNCFLLFIPIVLWDILLVGYLPTEFQAEIFWNDIPSFLYYGENSSRIFIFILAFLMPLHIKTHLQKMGLYIYVIGVLLYFSSWTLLIVSKTAIHASALFFGAPAYTPVFWLVGIGLISDSFYFKLPYSRWIFLSISFIFLLFHNAHAFMVYHRVF